MDDRTEIFEATRPRLFGLAYRMLGSVSDAQDAVQDTCLKWVTYEGPTIATPAAWLSRVCTNGCLDRLKAAHRTRVDYVGPWIPDQIQTDHVPGPETQAEIASSLTTAFLLLLERLTPKERAAYLLHDIFGMPFDEVATALQLQPANCRKLAARARDCVMQGQVRHVPDERRQLVLLAAFRSALETGNTDALAIALRADANLRADSGGKAVAVREIIAGASQICQFVTEILSPAWQGMRIATRTINGMPGLLIQNDTKLHAAISFAYDTAGQASEVFILRHPDKLDQLGNTRSSAAAAGRLWMH